jgi:hypothetical protein
VLSTVNEQAATDVFVRDCMVYVGTCIAPIGQGRHGERCADYEMVLPDGRTQKGTLNFGDLKLYRFARDQQARVTMQPTKQVDLGEGPGQPITRTVQGGVAGLLLDARGRPLQLPREHTARIAAILQWYQAVDLYPMGS